MSTVAEVMDVSRSNLHERLHGRAKPRRSDHKAQDAAVLPLIKALVAKRPTARSPVLPVRRAQRSDTRPAGTTGQRPAWRARRSL